MDHIRQIEILVAILEASLEAQMQTVQVMGRQRISSEIVQLTKQLAEALLRSIEAMENQYISEIEECDEMIMNHSAYLVRTINEAKTEMPDEPILMELSSVAKNGHRKLVGILGAEEEKSTCEVIRRFSKMKSWAQEFIARLERAGQ